MNVRAFMVCLWDNYRERLWNKYHGVM